MARETIRAPYMATGAIVGTACPTCTDMIKYGQAILPRTGFPKHHGACWLRSWGNYSENEAISKLSDEA